MMRQFGLLGDGTPVDELTIAAGNLSVTLLTYGARIRTAHLAGVAHNLTIGSDNLSDYENTMPFHGALVGPLANRLADGSTMIDGKRYQMERNQSGRHMLHSGRGGLHNRVWQVVEHGPAHATFAIDLPDGTDLFPGNRRITARFSVSAPATLRMDLSATTDAPTLMNLANHSFWNLDGSASWSGHQLRIASDGYLPVDADKIPTGEIRDVTGTGFDLRTARAPVPGEPAIDHNFCLSGAGALRDVLWLTGASGVRMTVATDQPGVQVYDAGAGARPGHNRHEAIAIEPQHWPDAPHHAGFPDVVLRPDQRYRQLTEWRFSAAAQQPK